MRCVLVRIVVKLRRNEGGRARLEYIERLAGRTPRDAREVATIVVPVLIGPGAVDLDVLTIRTDDEPAQFAGQRRARMQRVEPWRPMLDDQKALRRGRGIGTHHNSTALARQGRPIPSDYEAVLREE